MLVTKNTHFSMTRGVGLWNRNILSATVWRLPSFLHRLCDLCLQFFWCLGNGGHRHRQACVKLHTYSLVRNHSYRSCGVVRVHYQSWNKIYSARPPCFFPTQKIYFNRRFIATLLMSSVVWNADVQSSQDRQRTYHVTLWRRRITIVAV
jgi:hypothetical protein